MARPLRPNRWQRFGCQCECRPCRTSDTRADHGGNAGLAVSATRHGVVNSCDRRPHRPTRRNSSRNTSAVSMLDLHVKYFRGRRVRFPPPPLVNQSTGDHLWPALSRRKRGRAGLFHARGKGQTETRERLRKTGFRYVRRYVGRGQVQELRLRFECETASVCRFRMHPANWLSRFGREHRRAYASCVPGSRSMRPSDTSRLRRPMRPKQVC